ncbi:MAG: hypothetical protein RSB71_03870, partial [Bacilli bacterium]
MKKILYSLFFIATMLFCNSVKADNKVCYYKTDDEKITMAVVISDKENVAYLTKPYSKSDGFIEDQGYENNWKVSDILNGSSCKPYIVFKMNVGKNKLTAFADKPTVSKNEYILQNYDFESGASKCKYNGLNYMIDEGLKTDLNFLINGKSLFFYGNDLTEAMQTEIKLKTNSGKMTYYMSDELYDGFISNFDVNNASCPNIYTKKAPLSDSTFYTAGDLPAAYSLIESSFSTNIKENKILKEYSISYFREGQVDKVDFYFRSYSNGDEKICHKVNGTGESCAVVKKDEDIFFHISIDGQFTTFEIKKEELSKMFVYESTTDKATLRDPNPIYFNPDVALKYVISKVPKKGVIMDGNILSGNKYDDLVCKLYPYIKANKNYNSTFENPNNKK